MIDMLDDFRSDQRIYQVGGKIPNHIINLYLGVSENSVPLNPLVNDHYPY